MFEYAIEPIDTDESRGNTPWEVNPSLSSTDFDYSGDDPATIEQTTLADPTAERPASEVATMDDPMEVA